MNVEDFHEFIELSRQLNYREAAVPLCMSQSALSKHIKALEEFYGVALFTRDKKHVALTVEGGLLLEHAQKIWSEFALSRETITLSKSTRPLVLTGVVSSPDERGNVAEVMRYIQDKGIARRVRVTYASSLYPDEQLRLLAERAFDCFVAYDLLDEAEKAAADIAVVRLCEIPLCVAISPESALASKDSISLAEMAGGTFIQLMGPNFTPAWRIIERLLVDKGVPHVAKPMPADSVYDYLSLNLQGNFFVLPQKGRLSALEANPDMKVLPIDDADFSLHLDAAYLKSNEDESLRCLIDGLRACYQAAYSE